MKRSTARWTTAIAATALLALPAPGGAQTPERPTPATEQPGEPSESERQASGSETNTDARTRDAAQEHLRRAGAALNDIPPASLTGTVETRVSDLKRHLSMLETAAGTGAASPHAEKIAEVDRILTELLGAETTTGAPRTAGVEGAVGTSGAVTLDPTARMKLQEVRRHITAYAAAKSTAEAAGSSPSAGAAASSPTSASAPPSARSATATMSPRDPTPTATGTTATDTPQTAAPPQGGTSATPVEAGGASASGGQGQAGAADTETVKRHLTAARNALSGLTQLPSAAQLTGNTRVQVSQLISNFNELITTSSQWRAAYGKVEANVAALLGPEGTTASAPAASPSAAPSGAGEAVGTAGTTDTTGASGAGGIPEEIRAKLIEFRRHLKEFEKAAAGGTAAASSPAPSQAGTGSAAADVATRSSETDPTTASGSISTGSRAQPGSMPGSTAGGTGATAGAAAGETTRAAAPTASGDSARQAEARRHIEAIEAILNGRSAGSQAPTGTAGATGTPTETAGTSGAAKGAAPAAGGGQALDAAQIQQIRTHLNELRRVFDGSTR